MEKYSEYKILHAADPSELSLEVKQHLNDNWLLLGAPFSHKNESGYEFCQAMIKADNNRTGSIGFSRGS